MGDVAHVQQHIAADELIQGGLEGRVEVVRQVLNEADGVCDDGIATGWQLHPAHGRIQRLEEQVSLAEA